MPRQGPVRGIVGVRLSDEQRADAARRAEAAGYVKASGEPNLSDQIRHDLDAATAREVALDMVAPFSNGDPMWTSFQVRRCSGCGETHELVVVLYTKPGGSHYDEIDFCPRRREIVTGYVTEETRAAAQRHRGSPA